MNYKLCKNCQVVTTEDYCWICHQKTIPMEDYFDQEL